MQNREYNIHRSFAAPGLLASVLIVFIAVSVLLAARLAEAQGAPAGPQSGAAPSGQSAQENSPAAQQVDEKPNLAGTWKLNKDDSDNPLQKLQEAGGFGGWRRSGKRRRGNGNMMKQFSQLTIVQTGSSVKVTNLGGRVLASYSASAGAENSGTGNSSPAAEWQGSDLVATMQGPRGGAVTRTFELSPDGKQLYMINKIENPRLQGPVTIRFVYDRAKSGQ